MTDDLPSGFNEPLTDVVPYLTEFVARQEADKQKAEELQGLVQGMVRHFHLHNTAEAIRLPDADGVFPATTLWRPSFVVVDANTLRNDIIYACRHEGTPTTLVNGANAQMLRLFDSTFSYSEWEGGFKNRRRSFGSS